MFDKLKQLKTGKLPNFSVKKEPEITLSAKDSLYQDLINPYKIVFNPSYLECNDDKFIDFMLLNDMSGDKRANYLHPILRYPKKSIVSLFFSPINSEKFIETYKKMINRLKGKLAKDLENGKEPEKSMEKIIIEYEEMIKDFEDNRDALLNYSILYSQEMDVKGLTNGDVSEIRQLFSSERIQLRKMFNSNVQQPSKYYCPVGQMEQAYLSQQPLAEYRVKDWSNITAVNGMTLYPFFTESKEPGVEDGVPYGINRTTGELFFFNHTGMYNRQEITNRNMNVFGGTGSGKTSFMRTQIPLRFSYGDHFIIFDPKRDYVSFTKDLGGQNISFKVDQPLGFNIFSRSQKTYKVQKDDSNEIIEVDIQSIEKKKQNLVKIFQIMCPFLAEKISDSEFALTILDSAISNAYKQDTTGESISLQLFYDKYLNQAIQYYKDNESDKISSYSIAGERLKTNLSSFVEKEDGSKGQYYKMFLPVEKGQELVLDDSPLINFDLSNIFKDDKLFTIACLIGLEFTWAQIATKKWGTDKTLYVVIDENWKLLKSPQAAEYEEDFSRLIRGLGGGIYTMSQNLTEYTDSPQGQQVLAQAQINVVLKLDPNQLEKLKEHFPKWFTEEVNQDFENINKNNKSFGQGFIYMKSRIIPLKYLYLPSTDNLDSWQESKAWQGNLDTELGVVV